MKKILLSLAVMLSVIATSPVAYGQVIGKKPDGKDDGKVIIQDVKRIPNTSVKNQGRSGTCWCFATTSFLEAEILKATNKTYDLSEMFTVRNNYIRRVKDNYLRKGNGNIGEGSVAHMVLYVMKHQGSMPEAAYPDTMPNMSFVDHSMIQKYLQAMTKVSVDSRTRMPDLLLNGLLDSYLGKVPASFEYEGVEYTPKSFQKSLGLKLDDYVELTSFSHHPFYEYVPLEIPDNWDNEKQFNVPIDVLIDIFDKAIERGYTFAWDGDVSESTFRTKNFNVIYNGNTEKINGKDVVTQDIRQAQFENFTTTDDHLMHCVGSAKGSDGKDYYIIKNSWGPKAQDHGYIYLSKNYVAAKTISILINKNALDKDLRKQLSK